MAYQTPVPSLYVSERQIIFREPSEIAANVQTDVSVTYSDIDGNGVSDLSTINPFGKTFG